MRTSRCTPISLVSRPKAYSPVHCEGRGLQAGFFARLVVVEHGLEIPGARPIANTYAAACRPSPAIRCHRRPDGWSQSHCERRFRRRAGFRFRADRPVDAENQFRGAGRRRRFRLRGPGRNRRKYRRCGESGSASLRQHILQALFLAHDLLGFLWIRPEIRVGRPASRSRLSC